MALLKMLATHKCALCSIPQQKPTLINSNQNWKQWTRDALKISIYLFYLFIYLFITIIKFYLGVLRSVLC